ncbi:MAG: hypothetical protein IMZ44_08260 [Planctomycetes bacterium]|nr:hypothetical protein [Planctomycetota bacterium]
MTRLIFAFLAVAAMAALGCDSGNAGNPAPGAPEKPAASPPTGGAGDKPAPATPSADPPAAQPPAADPANAQPQPGSPAGLALASTAGGTSAGASSPPKGREIDNSRCHVCHGNFDDEPLAVNHAKQGVGCERCHGPCDEHCSDEGNITPPNILYAKDKVDKSCKECHPDPMERIVLDARYCLFVPLTDEENKKICSDCHGAHRMNLRTVLWDKATGKLLSVSGVAVTD